MIAKNLLRWYDKNARALAWRVSPAARKRGERPDPYRVWLSEIMLQQTTVATVARRFEEFLERWPTIKSLAAAPQDDVLGAWAGLGYYARARNLHKCAQVVAARGGFPDTEEDLRALPGVGAYTAAAIAAIAFDARAIVVDGNIERVAARLFAIKTPLPRAKGELKTALDAIWPRRRSGDFAQSLMDLGALVCTPRAPKCLVCPLAKDCAARATGVAARLPVKLRKPEKPTRRGIAYALINGRGEMLFERRPEGGLLGGMLGLPCTEWVVVDGGPPPSVASLRTPPPQAGEEGARGTQNASISALRLRQAPSSPAIAGEVSPKATEGALSASTGAEWKHAGTVRHSFTHFHLELDVFVASTTRNKSGHDNEDLTDNDWRWIAPETAPLPTVMKKAVQLALGQGTPFAFSAASQARIASPCAEV